MEKETRKTPPVRFKGFTDDWEQRKLSKIYGKIRNAFVGTATPYYVDEGHFYLESNNVKNGTINKSSQVFINNEFYYKQKDKWLHTGDMVMVQSGHVGQSAVIPKDLDNTAAHALIMFQNPQVDIAPYFLNAQYQTNTAKRKIDNITKGNTIKHILASDMEKFIVSVTSLAEQHKIAGLFQNIDNRIALHQRKCEQMKQAKKYFLQNMFPRKGETVPRIRFKGFTGAWEQRKLGDITKLNGRIGFRGYTQKDIISKEAGGILTLSPTNIVDNKLSLKEKNTYITKSKFDESPEIQIHNGDILFVKTGSTLGKSALVIGLSEPASINPQIVVIRSNIHLTQFLSVQLSTDIIQKQVAQDKIGGAVPTMTETKIKSFDIFVPSKLEEAKKIGEFFWKIDNRIALHQQKYEQLQQLKKFFLQNLFV